MVCWSSWHYCGVWMVWTVWIVPCFTSDWFLARVVVVRVYRHVSKARRCCMFSVVFVNECWINTLTNYTVNPGPTGLLVVGMPPKTSQSQIEAWPRCQITSWYGDDHQDMVVPCWVGFEIMFGHKMVACNVTLHGWDIGTSKLEQNLEPLSLEGVAAWTEREGHVRSCSHAYPLYLSLLMMTNDDVCSG